MHERRHWADNPELILHVLRLRFDKALSYLVISAQTGVSKAAIFLWKSDNPNYTSSRSRE